MVHVIHYCDNVFQVDSKQEVATKSTHCVFWDYRDNIDVYVQVDSIFWNISFSIHNVLYMVYVYM